MFTFTHSVGLYIVDRDLLPHELAEENGDGDLEPSVSFRINKAGEVEEDLGWGANTGRFPGRTSGDEDLKNVTTVVVEDSSAAREALSELARDHVERYHEGRLIPYPSTGEIDSLAWWVQAGMPVEDEDDAPEGLRDLERLPTPLSSSPKHVAQQEALTKGPGGFAVDPIVGEIRENQVETGLGIPTGGAGTPEELEEFEREAREESGAEFDPQTQRAVEDTERREEERDIVDVVDDPTRPAQPSESTPSAAEKVEAAKAKKQAKKAPGKGK